MYKKAKMYCFGLCAFNCKDFYVVKFNKEQEEKKLNK